MKQILQHENYMTKAWIVLREKIGKTYQHDKSKLARKRIIDTYCFIIDKCCSIVSIVLL